MSTQQHEPPTTDEETMESFRSAIEQDLMERLRNETYPWRVAVCLSTMDYGLRVTNLEATLRRCGIAVRGDGPTFIDDSSDAPLQLPIEDAAGEGFRPSPGLVESRPVIRPDVADVDHVHEKLRGALAENEELRQTIAALDEETSSLESKQQKRETYIAKLEEQLASVGADKERLCTQLKSEGHRRQDLRRQVDKLQGQILKDGSDQDEPTSEDLTKQFSDLVYQISEICMTVRDGYKFEPLKRTPKYVQHFFNMAFKLAAGDASILQWRLRTQFFSIIDSKLLSAPCFGFQRDDTEDKLVTFESQLWNADSCDPTVVTTWRRQTLRCARMLGGPVDSNNKTQKAADVLKAFIRPFTHLEEGEKKEVMANIETICHNAFQLALSMRNSRSEYEIEYIPEGTMIESIKEPDLIVLGTEDPTLSNKSPVGSAVQYNVAGALMKRDFGTARSIVLKQAQVICTSRKTGSG